MELRESMARILCRRNQVDPDRDTWINKGEKVKIWTVWADRYVDTILENLEK